MCQNKRFKIYLLLFYPDIDEEMKLFGSFAVNKITDFIAQFDSAPCVIVDLFILFELFPSAK